MTSCARRPRSSSGVDSQAEVGRTPAGQQIAVGQPALALHIAKQLDDEPVGSIEAIDALGLPRNLVRQRLAWIILHERFELGTLVCPPLGRMVQLRIRAEHDGSAELAQMVDIHLEGMRPDRVNRARC